MSRPFFYGARRNLPVPRIVNLRTTYGRISGSEERGGMSWKWAALMLLVGYAIGTVVGAATYLIDPLWMWVSMFTLMPLVFGACAAVYFTKAPGSASKNGILRLSLFWILCSVALDAAVYIAVLPLAFGAPPNWTFFRDQSPWIWLSYGSIVVIIAGGYWVHKRLRTTAHLPRHDSFAYRD